VIVVEANGEIALMNEAAGELLDASLSRVTGSRLIEVVRDHELQQLIARALATGEPIQGEVELLHRRRFLSATAVPLSQGPQGGVLLTLHDLTSIRQAETTRKEFVSNVSHEMRSPLASVKAMVETLEGGAIDDRNVAQDFLRRVHRDVNRMTTMVNDLLHLSRLESGQAELRPTAVDLGAVLEEAASQFRLQAAALDVGLVSDFPPALPRVRAEEEKLLQVLVNLLENALKFTLSGETITLWARDAGDRVEIGVSDTGVGIPREHLPHVFERFYKVDRARRDSGAGLGLAIVKHIVHAYGGEVGVRSEEGVGSTFTFTVPHASREA
jgi:two-component system phosphate regulon sensor histidine kinase PhoR